MKEKGRKAEDDRFLIKTALSLANEAIAYRLHQVQGNFSGSLWHKIAIKASEMKSNFISKEVIDRKKQKHFM